MIGITKEGKWLRVGSVEDIVNESWREGKTGAYLLPDAKEKSLLITEGSEYTKIKLSLWKKFIQMGHSLFQKRMSMAIPTILLVSYQDQTVS